jgi:hypothetical protein
LKCSEASVLIKINWHIVEAAAVYTQHIIEEENEKQKVYSPSQNIYSHAAAAVVVWAEMKYEFFMTTTNTCMYVIL